MRRAKWAVAVIALLGVVVPQSAGAYPGPTLPNVTVPPNVVPGTFIDVLGSNFEPGCPFTFTLLTSPSRPYGSGTVSGSGEAALEVLLPSLTEFSSYGGVIYLDVATTSPCNPETVRVALAAFLPATL